MGYSRVRAAVSSTDGCIEYGPKSTQAMSRRFDHQFCDVGRTLPYGVRPVSERKDYRKTLAVAVSSCWPVRVSVRINVKVCICPWQFTSVDVADQY